MIWDFPAKLDRVVDGDTYDVVVDMGFNCRRTVRVRLKGVDTAEVYGVAHDSDSYALGSEQSAVVVDWFDAVDRGLQWPFRVVTEKTGKYGRYVAEVFVPPDRVVPDGYERRLSQEILTRWPDATYDD